MRENHEHWKAAPMDKHGDAGLADHVDEEVFEEIFSVLSDESPEGLIRACDLFRIGVPARLAEIDDALAGGRYEEVATAAHSLRGSAGAFGARRLSNLADRLERISIEAEGDRSDAGPLVEEMRSEFLVFRAILDARLADLTA